MRLTNYKRTPARVETKSCTIPRPDDFCDYIESKPRVC